MIAMKNIVKDYYLGEQPIHVLKGIDVAIHQGELVAITGPSGSGKSTLMNIIGLLDRPTSGEYFLNENPVQDLSADEQADVRNKTIGFIFQSFFLLPRLTALQNVGLPLVYRDTKASEIKERALKKLEQVGMGDLTRHKPSELSGGQQQRVAIARALVGEPHMILADEPTGALDSKTSQEVMDILIQLNQDENATIVIVTHDPHVAEQCQRVIKVSDGHVISKENR